MFCVCYTGDRHSYQPAAAFIKTQEYWHWKADMLVFSHPALLDYCILALLKPIPYSTARHALASPSIKKHEQSNEKINKHRTQNWYIDPPTIS